MAGTLTDAEVERYRRDGYLAPVRAMGAADAAALAARYDAFRAREPGLADRVLRSKPHLVLPWLYDLARDPAVTGPVAAILGPDLLAWGSSFFAKPAGAPGYVAWHQDANYWGLEPHEVLTAWIAFTPSRRDNGCMRVVPGSHAGPALPHADTFAEDNLLSRGQEIAVAVDEELAADIVLEPGEMSLHHVGIVHGSEPNTGAMPRIGFAIRYIAAHVRQTGGFRATATLARGADAFGHFDPEPRPAAEFDAAGRAFRDDALARQARVLYAGAGDGPGKTGAAAQTDRARRPDPKTRPKTRCARAPER